MNLVKLDFRAIANDRRHRVILEQLADDIVDLAAKLTRVDIQPDRSEVEQAPGEAPSVTIGAHSAAAVSVEFGTRYRYASAPIRRAAMALGLKVPN